MRIDRLATCFLVQPLLHAEVLRAPSAIPILMYHSISTDSESGIRPYYRLATSPARFREHMRWLRETGYVPIALTAALEQLQRVDFPRDLERYVVLTFDDGLRDFITHAWPILADLGFTADVFLPTGYVGDRRRSFNGRDCLTWTEVRTLTNCGISFGAHTVTHPKLYGLPWQEVRRELRESRASIEHNLGQPVRTFAYPYAFPQEDSSFVSRFKEELVDSGYIGAVTTIIGRAQIEHDRLCLRRLPINECDDLSLFAAKMCGAYDWVGRLQNLVRRTTRCGVDHTTTRS